MRIREDDLTGAAVRALLHEHFEEMHRITPPKSAHVLDVDALRAPGITFWSAWEGEELVGCAALKELAAAAGETAGEIKSMRTVGSRRRTGVASRLLEHLTAEAERRGYDHLHCETAVLPEFAPARALYRKHGFEERGPFGGYAEDPNTVFLTKRLRGRG